MTSPFNLCLLDFYLGAGPPIHRVVALEAADPMRFTIESDDQNDDFGGHHDSG